MLFLRICFSNQLSMNNSCVVFVSQLGIHLIKVSLFISVFVRICWTYVIYSTRAFFYEWCSVDPFCFFLLLVRAITVFFIVIVSHYSMVRFGILELISRMLIVSFSRTDFQQRWNIHGSPTVVLLKILIYSKGLEHMFLLKQR